MNSNKVKLIKEKKALETPGKEIARMKLQATKIVNRNEELEKEIVAA